METKDMKKISKEAFETTLKNASDLLVTAEYERRGGKKYHTADVYHSKSLGLFYRQDMRNAALQHSKAQQEESKHGAE